MSDTDMFITVTMADEPDVVFHFEVPDYLQVADLKAMCERRIFADCLVEKGFTMPVAEMVLIADIQFLRGSFFNGREETISSSQGHFANLFHNFKREFSQ